MVTRRCNWNLMVLSAAGGELVSPVQYQKSLFLISKKIHPDIIGEGFYTFKADNFGPVDYEIFEDGRRLSREGLVYCIPKLESGYNEHAISLKGDSLVKIFASQFDDEVRSCVSSTVKWVRNTEFIELVRTVCRDYPEYKPTV